MKIRLIKNEQFQLVPYSELDEQNLIKIKQGIVYDFDVKKTRNPKFHRKFFALINKGFQNTKSNITNIDFYRAYITMKAGYYESIKIKDGVMVLPKSISFKKMDEFKFEKLYNACFNQIIIDIEADEELFRKELSGF